MMKPIRFFFMKIAITGLNASPHSAVGGESD